MIAAGMPQAQPWLGCKPTLLFICAQTCRGMLRGSFHYYLGLNTANRLCGSLHSYLLLSEEEGSVEQEHPGADCAGDRLL